MRSLPEQLREVFEGESGDPARERLFPRAYLDPTAESEEAEWQALVHPSLLRERLDALELITSTLARAALSGDWWQIALTPDEVQAWLGVLNDTRLVLGTRLGVTEDERELRPVRSAGRRVRDVPLAHLAAGRPRGGVAVVPGLDVVDLSEMNEWSSTHGHVELHAEAVVAREVAHGDVVTRRERCGGEGLGVAGRECVAAIGCVHEQG